MSGLAALTLIFFAGAVLALDKVRGRQLKRLEDRATELGEECEALRAILEALEAGELS